MDEETAKVTPKEEFSSLKETLRDNQIRYERASAEERMYRDNQVATWRDAIHSTLQSPGGIDVIRTLHTVIDSMDNFLNHAGGKRK